VAAATRCRGSGNYHLVRVFPLYEARAGMQHGGLWDGGVANVWWPFRNGSEVEGGGGAATFSSCWSVGTEKMRLCKIFCWCFLAFS
jgi:hypothetical protein